MGELIMTARTALALVLPYDCSVRQSLLAGLTETSKESESAYAGCAYGRTISELGLRGSGAWRSGEGCKE